MAEFLGRLEQRHPFVSLEEALAEIAFVLRAVEDEMSGIIEDPNAAYAKKSDGRMYPPHPRFRVLKTPLIEAYRQKGHLTTIAINGAICIRAEPTGVVVLDLRGSDGRTVSEVLEVCDERS